MTVKELSKVLLSIPEEYQDLRIVDCSYDEIEGKWELFKEHPIGDYANPNCKYEDVIYIE